MLNYVEYGKENKYDDDIFFQKYSQMSRSQQGLAGAGEWEKEEGADSEVKEE